MWIRNQSRKGLSDCKLIHITDNKILAIYPECEITLGTYSTHERALEVLDEIQEQVTIQTINEHKTVYEMPKE